MKHFKIIILLFLIFYGGSSGQPEEPIKITRCTSVDVVISQIDIIGQPIPRDDEGNQISQIKTGFTTLYVSGKPDIINDEKIQEINKIFNGEKVAVDLSAKSQKIVPVGLEMKSVSFVVLKNRTYFLVNVYPDILDHVMTIELSKIVEKDNTNIFTLKVPFAKKVFLYPELAKLLIKAGDIIK